LAKEKGAAAEVDTCDLEERHKQSSSPDLLRLDDSKIDLFLERIGSGRSDEISQAFRSLHGYLAVLGHHGHSAVGEMDLKSREGMRRGFLDFWTRFDDVHYTGTLTRYLSALRARYPYQVIGQERAPNGRDDWPTVVIGLSDETVMVSTLFIAVPLYSYREIQIFRDGSFFVVDIDRDFTVRAEFVDPSNRGSWFLEVEFPGLMNRSENLFGIPEKFYRLLQERRERVSDPWETVPIRVRSDATTADWSHLQSQTYGGATGGGFLARTLDPRIMSHLEKGSCEKTPRFQEWIWGVRAGPAGRFGNEGNLEGVGGKVTADLTRLELLEDDGLGASLSYAVIPAPGDNVLHGIDLLLRGPIHRGVAELQFGPSFWWRQGGADYSLTAKAGLVLSTGQYARGNRWVPDLSLDLANLGVGAVWQKKGRRLEVHWDPSVAARWSF